MRAITMKCPNCGANLEAQEAAHTVMCNYCGTKARIQHRTRFLERKVEMPPPPPAERRLPVARQKHGTRWLVGVTTLLPVLMTGGITLGVMYQTGSLSKIGNAISEAAEDFTSDRMLYSGAGNALLFDVNGDGHLDVISSVRYVQNNDSYHLAAFDGLGGEKLWESETFGNHDDATGGTTALHDSTVVQSDSRGNISGFAVTDGVRTFKVSLGEKLKGLCADSDSSLAVHLADKSWKSMELDTGTFTPLDGEPDPCEQVPTGDEHGQIDVDYSEDHRRARNKRSIKIDGMQIRETVALLNQPGRFLALGHKDPGTRIPMIALFHDSELDVPAEAPEPEETGGKKRRSKKRAKKSRGPEYVVDWSSDLPGLDPLGVREGAPTLAVANQRCVATLYETKEGSPHLVCFSPEGGQRLWDSKLPKRTTYVLRALDITDDRIYVGQWSELDAFDIADGTKVFTLGY